MLKRNSPENVEDIGSELLADILRDTRSLFQEETRRKSVISQIANDLRVSTQRRRSTVVTTTKIDTLSELELRILNATEPINMPSINEELTVINQTGLWLNKDEVTNWKGEISINDYKINNDLDPEIIRKSNTTKLNYIQDLSIKYLRPSSPLPAGDITINQEPNYPTAPAPPIIIRQMQPRAVTPDVKIYRETPPKKPIETSKKIVVMRGNRIPPPPRRVVIERLPRLPPKPAPIQIERWLPYQQLERRVVFNKNKVPDPVQEKPRNLIINWEPANYTIEKQVKYLGVSQMDPDEYVREHGDTLIKSGDLPKIVTDIETPNDLILATDYKFNPVHKLVGDVKALKLIDMEAEGLTMYTSQVYSSDKEQIKRKVSSFKERFDIPSNILDSSILSCPIGEECTIDEIFEQIDKDGDGQISLEETANTLLRLNSVMRRSYGEDDLEIFFSALDKDRKGSISISEFKKAFLPSNL